METEAKLCALSFKANEYLQQKNWKWTDFKSKPPLLKRKQSASGIVIKTKDHKKKYFICGGIPYGYDENDNHIQ